MSSIKNKNQGLLLDTKKIDGANSRHSFSEHLAFERVKPRTPPYFNCLSDIHFLSLSTLQCLVRSVCLPAVQNNDVQKTLIFFSQDFILNFVGDGAVLYLRRRHKTIIHPMRCCAGSPFFLSCIRSTYIKKYPVMFSPLFFSFAMQYRTLVRPGNLQAGRRCIFYCFYFVLVSVVVVAIAVALQCNNMV